MAFRKFKTWICAFLQALFMTVGAFTQPSSGDDPSLVLNNIRSSRRSENDSQSSLAKSPATSKDPVQVE